VRPLRPPPALWLRPPRVTIPIEIRRQFGIGPETEVEVVDDVGQLRKVRGTGRGRRALDRLPATRHSGPTAEELMALTRGEE
jgi:bifunctional DNA-binding transcriptional regulator/antitoxin component of YhaV-PrlF toxin-antitoxin module